MGRDLQRIMDAIEGSKSILNELVVSSEEGLSSEITLRVSRELDELLNLYNSMHEDGIEGSREINFF